MPPKTRSGTGVIPIMDYSEKKDTSVEDFDFFATCKEEWLINFPE